MHSVLTCLKFGNKFRKHYAKNVLTLSCCHFIFHHVHVLDKFGAEKKRQPFKHGRSQDLAKEGVATAVES